MTTLAFNVDNPQALNLHKVNLHDHDVVVINSSAGADSQAMLSYLAALANAQGYSLDRFIVVHADLGRVEWEGTRELAEEQARFYGLRFEAVARDEDLLDQVVTRRRTLDAKAETMLAEGNVLEADKARNTPAWPSSQARYCTSDQKTSQVVKLMTRLADAHRAAGNTRPLRILNCLGLRADESPARAKKKSLHRDTASNGRREVTRWLPIFTWTAEQVWDTIRRSGVPYHPAYDAGT